MTIPPSELAAMRQRCEAATKGDWEVIKSRDVLSAVICPGVQTIACDFERDSDAEFVKHAREDMPRLLDALEHADREKEAAVRAAVEAERERCRKICHEIGQEYLYEQSESVYRAMWRIEKGDEQ